MTCILADNPPPPETPEKIDEECMEWARGMFSVGCESAGAVSKGERAKYAKETARRMGMPSGNAEHHRSELVRRHLARAGVVSLG